MRFSVPPTMGVAVLLGLVTALAVGIATIVLHQVATADSLPSLLQANQAGITAIGRSVADQVAQALGYGIPLEALHGVEPFLATLVNGSPGLDAMGLATLDGRLLHASGEVEGAIAFPVMVDGIARAELLLSPAEPLVGPVTDRLWLTLAVTCGLAGLLAGAATLTFLARHQAVARDRLQDLFAQLHADRFDTVPEPSGTGLVADAFTALDRALDPLRTATRALSDAVATVRAIDFDGSLSDRVTALVTPVERVMVLAGADRLVPADRSYSATGALWLSIVIAGLYAASMPFVANFAIDRQSGVVPTAFWPILPTAVEALVAVIAGSIGLRLVPWIRRPAAIAGLVACGVAYTLVHGTRDYADFVLYRGIAAAGLGIAVGALLSGQATRLLQGWTGLLLFGVVVAGPVTGGLLGEAIGRRAAFLTIGLGFLLAALLPLMIQPVPRHSQPDATGPRLAERLRSIAAGLAFGGLFWVWMPVRVGYENYLVDGLWIGLAGLCAAVIPVPWRSLGLVLLVAGLIGLGWPGVAALSIGPAMVAIGLGLRGMVGSNRAADGSTVWGMGLVGVSAGALAVGVFESFGYPPLVGVAALTGVIGAFALLVARSPRSR